MRGLGLASELGLGLWKAMELGLGLHQPKGRRVLTNCARDVDDSPLCLLNALGSPSYTLLIAYALMLLERQSWGMFRIAIFQNV